MNSGNHRQQLLTASYKIYQIMFSVPLQRYRINSTFHNTNQALLYVFMKQRKSCPSKQDEGIWGRRHIAPPILDLGSGTRVVVRYTIQAAVPRGEKNAFA